MSDRDACRRGFLKVGAAGAAVLLVPGCGGAQAAGDDAGPPAEAGSDSPSGDDAGEAGPADGGACQGTCSTGAKIFEFPFAKYPQLQNVGGSASANATGYADPVCGNDVIIVVQVSAGKYAAFSAACSHQCCNVSWVQSRTQFHCPCHDSTFDATGQVTGGPAPTALTKLAACADACGVYVTFS